MACDGLPKYQQYSQMSARLSTFRSWPVSCMHPYDLASAGMFYAGEHDRVTCYICGNSLESFEPGDDVWQMHAMMFPECSLTNNDILPNDLPYVMTEECSDDVPPNISEGYYQQFYRESDRLKTFYDWTDARKLEEDLAKEGFISHHNGDRVQCVFCKVCISYWAPQNSISQTHLLLSPACPLANGYETRNIPLPSPIEDAMLEFGFALEDIRSAMQEIQIGGENINDLCNRLLDRPVNDAYSQNIEQSQPLQLSQTSQTEEKLCIICCDEPANMVLLPCGHLFSCQRCAHMLDECSICRKRITGRIHALF